MLHLQHQIKLSKLDLDRNKNSDLHGLSTYIATFPTIGTFLVIPVTESVKEVADSKKAGTVVGAKLIISQ